MQEGNPVCFSSFFSIGFFKKISWQYGPCYDAGIDKNHINVYEISKLQSNNKHTTK